MNSIVLVTGTGTEVGKTFVAAAVLRELQGRFITVAARKPAQSFDPADPAPHDSEVLADVTGESADEICPSHRCYPIAMAPPMAADALQLPRITLADLIGELAPSPAEVMIVEGAGGLRSPIAHDGDGLDLIGGLPTKVVVIVADAGLGTINAVLLTVDAIAHRHTMPVVVMLNRFDEANALHIANAAYLQAHTPGPIVHNIITLTDEILNIHRGF